MYQFSFLRSNTNSFSFVSTGFRICVAKGGYRVSKSLFRVLLMWVTFCLISSTAIFSKWFCIMAIFHILRDVHGVWKIAKIKSHLAENGCGTDLIMFFSPENFNFFMGLPWKILHWLFVLQFFSGHLHICMYIKEVLKMTNNPMKNFSLWHCTLRSPLKWDFWKVAKMRHLGLPWKVFNGAFVPPALISWHFYIFRKSQTNLGQKPNEKHFHQIFSEKKSCTLNPVTVTPSRTFSFLLHTKSVFSGQNDHFYPFWGKVCV